MPFADYLVCVAMGCRFSVNQLTNRESFGETVHELTGNSKQYYQVNVLHTPFVGFRILISSFVYKYTTHKIFIQLIYSLLLT